MYKFNLFRIQDAQRFKVDIKSMYLFVFVHVNLYLISQPILYGTNGVAEGELSYKYI